MSEGITLQQELPEAGWFADPADHRMQRYWGGKNWTDHVRYSDANSQPISHTAAPTIPLHNDYASIPTTGSTPITQPAQFEQSTLVVQPPQIEQAPQFGYANTFDGATQYAQPVPFESPVPPVSSAYNFGGTPVAVADSAFNFAPSPNYAPTTGPTSVVGVVRDFNPDPDAMPYVPLSTLHSASHTYTPAWQQKTSSPSTGAVWLIAFMPALAVAIQLGILLLAPQLVNPTMRAGSFVVSAFLLVAIAFSDRAALTGRGLRGASPWWMVLSPLAYLIFRGIAVSQSGVRYWTPVFAFVGIALLSGLAATAVILQLG